MMKMKKNMKGIDLSCASPASTAICSNSTVLRNGIKPSIHQYYNKTFYNISTSNNNNNNNNNSIFAPCISELPFTPRPRKSTTSSFRPSPCDVVPRRNSSADVTDLRRGSYRYSPPGNSSRYLLADSESLLSDSSQGEMTRKSLALVPSTPIVDRSELRRSRTQTQTKTRTHTPRLGTLLGAEKEKNNSIKINNNTTSLALVKVDYNDDDQRVVNYDSNNKHGVNGGDYDERQKSMGRQYSKNDSLVLKPSSSSRSRDQVVVLRVSLHCKGCAGKLRKHLSKMEGVTSFNIDLETKKVTVVGNVTPLGVLTSISKVKYAQFWPSPPSTSSSTSSSSSSSSGSSTVDFSY